MKTQLSFHIGVVKPNKRVVRLEMVKAKDSAWRRAIFGFGGSSKRIGGAVIGMVDGQPLSVIGELPDTVADETPVWTITTDRGLFAFAGPCAVFNNAGFGPATLGITRIRLQSIVDFDPSPENMIAGLKRTLEARSQDHAE